MKQNYFLRMGVARIIFFLYLCTGFQSKLIMEEKLFTVCAMFGLQTRLMFVSNAPKKNEGSLGIITEVTENGSPVFNGGIVTVDLKMSRAGISYGHWSFALDIIAAKEVDGNYHLKCATDLCRVDLFICEKTVWNEKGESIFL